MFAKLWKFCTLLYPSIEMGKRSKFTENRSSFIATHLYSTVQCTSSLNYSTTQDSWYNTRLWESHPGLSRSLFKIAHFDYDKLLFLEYRTHASAPPLSVLSEIAPNIVWQFLLNKKILEPKTCTIYFESYSCIILSSNRVNLRRHLRELLGVGSF